MRRASPPKKASPDGRQQGGHADASDPAVTGRLEYRHAGLTAGGSFWRGGSGFGLIRLDIETPTVTVASLDARYRRGRHELRGQWSMVNIGGAGDLNRALQLQSGNSPNIASRLLGAYGEAGRRACRPTRWTHEVVAFGRYEMFDTQNKMPDGLPAARGVAALGVGRSARRISRIPTSRSSSTSVRERNKSEGRPRAVARQFRCGLVVLIMMTTSYC